MYFFDSRIRYSEIDCEGKLSFEALLNYFQDCSTFHAQDSGVGLEYLKEKHLAWVLSAWQIAVQRYAQLGEKVRVATAPYDFKGFLGYRNFLIETECGERLACANTIWTLMDLDTMRPAKPNENMKKAYVLSEKLDMPQMERKIEIPRTDGIVYDAIDVKSFHLDTNRHVNNAKYIQIAMEYLPQQFAIGQMRAEYKKQARLLDKIVPVVYAQEDKYTVALRAADGEIYCTAEFVKCI